MSYPHVFYITILIRILSSPIRTYSIMMPLGFKKVTVAFTNYNAESMFSSINGSMTADINDITFVMDLGFNYSDGNCSLIINSFTEPHFSVDNLLLTGPNKFTTWYRTKMAKFIIKNFKTPIKEIMSANMIPIFTVILKNEEQYICKLINLFIYFYEQVELL